MQTIHSDLEMLLANVEQLNEKRIQSTRRAAWISVLIMFFIFLGVALAGYFIYMNMLKMQQANNTASQEYARKITELKNQNQKQLEELTSLRKLELDKLNSDFDIKNKEFQKELQTQKEELSSAFADLKKSVAERREAELIKLREAFAAEQKITLEKLIAKEKELTAIQQKLETLENRAAALKKHTDSLQKKTEDLNNRLQKEQQDKKRIEEDFNALQQSIKEDKEDK